MAFTAFHCHTLFLSFHGLFSWAFFTFSLLVVLLLLFYLLLSAVPVFIYFLFRHSSAVKYSKCLRVGRSVSLLINFTPRRVFTTQLLGTSKCLQLIIACGFSYHQTCLGQNGISFFSIPKAFIWPRKNPIVFVVLLYLLLYCCCFFSFFVFFFLFVIGT